MFYDFALNNVCRYLQKITDKERNSLERETLTAFDISRVLSIVFCKAQEDILNDIVSRQLALA